MQKNEDGSYHGFNVSNKYYWVVCSGVGQGIEKTFPDSEGNPDHISFEAIILYLSQEDVLSLDHKVL